MDFVRCMLRSNEGEKRGLGQRKGGVSRDERTNLGGFASRRVRLWRRNGYQRLL